MPSRARPTMGCAGSTRPLGPRDRTDGAHRARLERRAYPARAPERTPRGARMTPEHRLSLGYGIEMRCTMDALDDSVLVAIAWPGSCCGSNLQPHAARRRDADRAAVPARRARPVGRRVRRRDRGRRSPCRPFFRTLAQARRHRAARTGALRPGGRRDRRQPGLRRAGRRRPALRPFSALHARDPAPARRRRQARDQRRRQAREEDPVRGPSAVRVQHRGLRRRGR